MEAEHKNASNNGSLLPLLECVKDHSALSKIILASIFVAIFLSGVTGNTMVCFVLGKKKVKKSDILIISLATVDLVSSFNGPVGNIIFMYMVQMDELLVKLYFATTCTTLFGSLWILMLITIERFCAITRPLEFRRISSKARIIPCVVILALTLAIMLFAVFHDSSITLVSTYFVFLFPVTIIAILYAICMRRLNRSVLQNIDNQAYQRRLMENKRICKMFLIIISLNCICVVPFAIFIAIDAYIANKMPKTAQELCYVFGMLRSSLLTTAYINGCINPFIYAKVHPDIKHFATMLWRKCARKKSDIEDSAVTNKVQQNI